MLVLARKLGESIVVGDDIVIKVISLEKGVVKIGIDAPRKVPVVRSELLEDVKDANISSSIAANSDDVSALLKLVKIKNKK